ncbi:hypothetical protein GGH99_007249 [Coemansia sp. RSA 1285]|nr:hypothetical protein GGH99_007249 [Coemansia sp. RSA 1285]
MVEPELSLCVSITSIDRGKRLTDARSGAASEIAELQERMNKELEKVQNDSVDQSALTEKIEKATAEKLEATMAMFEKNKAEAVSKLVEAVATAELDESEV